MADEDKKPYTPQQRQAFVDSLPAEERNDDPEEVFKKAISRAAQPNEQVQEKSVGRGDYNGT